MLEWQPIEDFKPDDERQSVLIVARYPDGKSWSAIVQSWQIIGPLGQKVWATWRNEFPPTHFAYFNYPTSQTHNKVAYNIYDEIRMPPRKLR